MKCQILFSWKNKKKNFNMSSAENFTQSAKRLVIRLVGFLPIFTREITFMTYCLLT